jgi:lysozyme
MATSNIIIDLSHNNGNVDLGRANAAGIVGVIHKATQGSGFKDRMYAARRKLAQQAGLLWGAYHFATAADPVAQAKFFLSVAQPGPGDLIVLDFEQNEATPANSMSLDQARTFISTIQDVAEVTPGLYGGSYLKQQLAGTDDDTLGACWLWWSQYGPAPAIPPAWSDWTLWQYTDGHHGNPPFEVNGVGPCDRDRYQGTPDDLQAKWATGSLT